MIQLSAGRPPTSDDRVARREEEIHKLKEEVSEMKKTLGKNHEDKDDDEA